VRTYLQWMYVWLRFASRQGASGLMRCRTGERGACLSTDVHTPSLLPTQISTLRAHSSLFIYICVHTESEELGVVWMSWDIRHAPVVLPR